ncbi:MAG: hypothetical protein JW746_10090 [Candidatus Krumholzibacteriota bacterium]|nr:hypothetical protein [Candidatus Krumholzibacteriota bacterium]
MSRISAIIVFLFVIIAGCATQSSDKEKEKVGGCQIDTIRTGFAVVNHSVLPTCTYRISIRSVKDVGKGSFVTCAKTLTEILLSTTIKIGERSDILHIVKGPCWPAYSIIFRIDVPGEHALDLLHETLLGTEFNSYSPSEERPEGYGTFFITLSKGSSDIWTVWYTGGI